MYTLYKERGAGMTALTDLQGDPEHILGQVRALIAEQLLAAVLEKH